MSKYCASSATSPSRFQVLPVREISDSRVTTPATIHCCSVASSRQLFWSPFSSRISHWRSAAVGPSSITVCLVGSSFPALDSDGGATAGRALAGVGRPDCVRSRVCTGRAATVAELELGAALALPLGIAVPTVGTPCATVTRFRILNMCPQFVHLTVTPVGFSRASSSSYSVPHFSQRTSMAHHACCVLWPRTLARTPPRCRPRDRLRSARAAIRQFELKPPARAFVRSAPSPPARGSGAA